MNNKKTYKDNVGKRVVENNIILYAILPFISLLAVVALFMTNAKKIDMGSSLLDIFSNSNKKVVVEKETESFKSLTEEEFSLKKKENKDIVIIDIRTKKEIELGKISENALEIDFYNKNFKEELNKLDKNKEYFIYCAHGNRTRDAKEKMKELNFKKVSDLKGGIATWKSRLFLKKEDNVKEVKKVENVVKKTEEKKIIKKPVAKPVVKKPVVKKEQKSIHRKEAKDFKGKVTFIAITSTQCPHCRDEVPLFEKNIYKKYGNKINFYVNVVNGGRWRQNIPQGTNPNLKYKYITGKKCGFVPSWVILNKNGNVVKSVCGGPVSSAYPVLRRLVK